MSELSQRVEALAESATLAITARAKALRAAGEPVVSYGAGEPDFPTPPHIVDAARKALDDPSNHRYTPGAGLPDLRQAIADKTARDSGFVVDSSQVVVTNGGKHAVYTTFQVLIDPGDEVLLPAPYWVTYPEAISLAGGVPVVVSAGADAEYRVTVEQLEAVRTERTKLLVFCSPSNPTGAVHTEDEIRAIGEWAAEHDIWVMADEIYEHLVYGDATFASLPTLVPAAAERTIVVNGVAKTYAMTGWRVGWMVAPEAAAKAAIRLQSHLTSNVNNIAQEAALAAVAGPLDAVAEMREAFDRRRRIMHGMLNDVPGVTCPEPKGAFYAFPDVTGLLDRQIGSGRASSSLDLAALLLNEIKIATVPGEAFGAPGHLRLSYALGDEDLIEGLTRFQRLVEG